MKIKIKKNIKRGKYLKTNNKSEFLKNIHYLEIKDGKKTWKYALSQYNDKSNSGYYYCSDTTCKGKGTYTFNQNNITEYEKKINKLENFELTKEHTLTYEKHNYNINIEVYQDINNNINKKDLINKLGNITYLQNYLKLYVIKKNDIISSAAKLYNLFIEEYGEIILNYEDISEDEKNKLITTYKKKKIR